MQKFLIFLIIIFVLGLLFKSWLYSLRKKFVKQFEQSTQGRERVVNKGKMVKCTVCSTYFPSSEAVGKKINGDMLFFCSEDCRKEYKKK